MLTDKIALVTGASRGIGAAIAKAFAKEGAAVIINYNGSGEKAQAVADEIILNGGAAEIYQCSVADFDACRQMIETLVKKYGRIDILVNNAGITKDGLLMKMSEEDFDSVIDINLKGAFHTIRHMSRYFLKQRSGKIINISSVSGILGNAGQANYSASKAGVIGLTKSTARELASRGIQVNAIAPGFIETDMTDAMQAEAKERMTDAIPLKRIGKPEEIADLAVFLASAKSDYITGQVIAADGGMSI
ncbi:3-oxoacyl-[acyl-carrier-protein] reductase FabG [Lachnospiraceae bacterium]|mgnify:CR=1 FL=1|jgi:3-oxoacyl-[acyl-carrier protein] reductase|nr:3-oxoacyl-[acyl-carrier-protein] reductase [Eubacterium sp.]GFI25715.1 3-oxoacyl-[acyl-carrier-protein] reductase FabG [Lachnospiraceae bacterium]